MDTKDSPDASNLVMVRESINEKLLKYVLNRNHPKGKFKAKYFASIGFTHTNWAELGDQLIFDSQTSVKTQETEFGVKYTQVIEIELPNSRGRRNVVTCWINLHGTNEVRLVTCYPD